MGEVRPGLILEETHEPSDPARLPLFLSAGTSRGQYHTLQAGFSSRSQGLGGDNTSVSDTLPMPWRVSWGRLGGSWKLQGQGEGLVSPQRPLTALLPALPTDLPAHCQAHLQPCLLVFLLSCGPELQSEAELCPQRGQHLWGCRVWGSPAHCTHAYPAPILPRTRWGGEPGGL